MLDRDLAEPPHLRGVEATSVLDADRLEPDLRCRVALGHVHVWRLDLVPRVLCRLYGFSGGWAFSPSSPEPWEDARVWTSGSLLVAPESIEVGVECASIGRTSFVLEHDMYERKTGRLVAEARKVLVHYDYNTLRPIPIGEDLRRKILAQDPEAKQG